MREFKPPRLIEPWCMLFLKRKFKTMQKKKICYIKYII